MAGQATIACIGPSYTLSDKKAAIQRAVNLYMLNIEGLGEAKRVVLASAPGLELLVNVGTEFRGSYNTDSRWFVVFGTKLLEMAEDGTYTERGTLATNSGFVSMKSGRDQLVLVDGTNGYVFNLNTNVFGQITDTDYSMPKGYKSGFTAMLGERIAPSLLGHIPPEVARAAKAARMRLASQAVDPAIMAGGNRGGNIFSGFR